MGIDFSYILYFDRNKLWDALQAVIDIASHHQSPTKIVFPDHILNVPLETWPSENGEYRFNDPTVSFHFSIDFEEDESIEYYMRNRGVETYRSPPEELTPRMVSIGYIYLDIYQGASERLSGIGGKNIVAFNFGTTGTRMSLLFYESTSIRKKFVEMLDRVPGICGVFNREDNGEVFWYKGQSLDEYIPDPYLLPSKIKDMLDLQD